MEKLFDVEDDVFFLRFAIEEHSRIFSCLTRHDIEIDHELKFY